VPNSIYYYALYRLDIAGALVSPSYLFINTSLFAIYGFVQDSTGIGIAGSKVTLKDTDDKILSVTYSGADERYFFGNLENGNYTLEVSHISHNI
jgi:hypothetical protein